MLLPEVKLHLFYKSHIVRVVSTFCAVILVAEKWDWKTALHTWSDYILPSFQFGISSWGWWLSVWKVGRRLSHRMLRKFFLLPIVLYAVRIRSEVTNLWTSSWPEHHWPAGISPKPPYFHPCSNNEDTNEVCLDYREHKTGNCTFIFSIAWSLSGSLGAGAYSLGERQGCTPWTGLQPITWQRSKTAIPTHIHT